MVHRRQCLKIYSLKFCDIWQNFFFYRTFNNKNFKMEVERTNFEIHLIITVQSYYCERFEPRSHFKSRLSLIVRVNVVPNRTVVVDSDWRFDNLCWIVANSYQRRTNDLLTRSSKTNYERTTGELTIWLTKDNCLTVTIDWSKRTNYWLRVFIANNITA